MSLIFMDGFDHYGISQAPDKGHTFGGSWESMSSSYQRFGTGRGFAVTRRNGWWITDIGSIQSVVYMGIAFKKADADAPSLSTSYPFISIRDEASVQQVNIIFNSSRGINAYSPFDTLLGSSEDSLVKDWTWHHLEIKVVISATVGEVVIKLDGSVVLNLINQNTKVGTDYIRYLRFSNIYYDNDCFYDDLFVDDAQFRGDCQVKAYYPDADGNSADFTRSAGSNDFECVDEAISNEDTDFIFSETLNHKSIFGITTGALATVQGIQVSNHCKLEAAGTRNIKAICRSNGADYQGAESPAISAEYIFEHEIWEDDPDDSNPWTQAKLEAAEFGLEITT